MAKLKPNKDRLPSTDTTTHTKKETYSYFRLKLVVLVSTLRALILSSFTTQIGTLRTTSKQQPELTESVKRVKSWSTVWSLAILMRQKCLKEQHKNLVSIRLFLWAELSSKLGTEYLLEKIRWLKLKWRYFWREVSLDFWRMLSKMKRKRLNSSLTKM